MLQVGKGLEVRTARYRSRRNPFKNQSPLESPLESPYVSMASDNDKTIENSASGLFRREFLRSPEGTAGTAGTAESPNSPFFGFQMSVESGPRKSSSQLSALLSADSANFTCSVTVISM